MLPKNGLVHRTIEQNLFFFLGGEGCVVVSRLANKAFEIRPKKKNQIMIVHVSRICAIQGQMV